MQRSLIAVGVVFVVALLLACGSGTPTITSPSAVPAAAQTTAAPAVPTAADLPTAAPEPTAPPAPTIGKVGDKVELDGVALTVMKVDHADAVGKFQKVKDGNTFVIAEVVIENVSTDKAPYNPLYFKVKDADGFEYNAGISMADNGLKSGDLMKGDKARGTVLFEVKKDAKGLVLEYKPIVFGGGDPIKIALE